MADFLATRRFGDAEATVINYGWMEWTPTGFPQQDWHVDETPVAADGRAVMGINGMVVRLGDAIIVVDPNEFAPDEVMGSATVHVGDGIGRALDALGIDAAAVTHVLISHGHPDHFTGLVVDGEPRFANAAHYFPAADWQYFVVDDERGSAGILREHLGPVEAHGLLTLVEADLEVAPGVTLLLTPGESPGHLSVRFESGGARLFYLGDLVHFPAEFRHIDWVAVANRDALTLAGSRTRVFAEAADATFVFTHGQFPTWGSVEPAGAGAWAWRYAQ